MGIFDFFNKALIFRTVESIETKIKQSKAWNYFNSEDIEFVSEYKEFELTIIASSLATIILDLDSKNQDNMNDIQSVYFGKTAPFLRKLLLRELKVHGLEITKIKERQEMMLNLAVRSKFERYVIDIKRAIEDKSIYYFKEYEKPEFNYQTETYKKGENRMFNFLWNFFLAKEGYDFEGEEIPTIDYKVFLELNEMENRLLNEFIIEISNYQNE